MSSDNEWNYHKKSDLANDAESLANSSYETFKEWKEAKEQMTSIIEEWKNTGSPNCREARRYSDDPSGDLNDRFKTALDEFFSKGEELKQELENTLNDRESKKQDLLVDARSLLSERNVGEAMKTFRNIVEEWKGVGYSGDLNQDHWDDLQSIGNQLREKLKNRNAQFEVAAKQKKALIEELETALSAADGKSKMQIVRAAEEKWKTIALAGREENGLRERFRIIVDAQKQQAQEFAQKVQERANKKREIIMRAQQLAKSSEQGAWNSFRVLLAEWKAIGSAGRIENELWKQLSEAGDVIKQIGR
jgi:polyhydroxyalkanoate synthesis regulator phasin